MNISLTRELEEFIGRQVEGGLYSSASEVVRDALRLLVDEKELKAAKLEALRLDIQEGLDSPSKPWDLDSFLEEARTRQDS